KRLFAGAGQYRHPAFGIRSEVVPDRRQLLIGWRMQRVHHLWPVDRDARDAALLLVFDELVAHVRLLFSSRQSKVDSRRARMTSVSFWLWPVLSARAPLAASASALPAAQPSLSARSDVPGLSPTTPRASGDRR